MSVKTGAARIVLALESSGPGGAEQMVVQLASELSALGYHAIVATMREGWMTDRARTAGLPIWVLPQRPGVDLAWVMRLARRLRRESVDILHTHEFAMNAFGGTAAAVAGVRSLATVHGKRWIGDRKRRTLAYRLLRRAGVPIVAVSEDLAQYLSETLRMPLDRLLVVRNGIPLSDAMSPQERVAARAGLGIPVDGPLLVAVGNLYPVKDHGTLLRAVVDLPGVRVAIAGRGEEEPRLRQLAAELGIVGRIHLLGLRDDVDRVLTAADLFVQPSLSEGLPLAVLEAMAAGLPVVATRIGGVPEAVVHGSTGLLVEPGAPSELSAALGELLADPARLRAMGNAARERVAAEFSVSAMARRYTNLYSSLLGRKADRSR